MSILATGHFLLVSKPGPRLLSRGRSKGRREEWRSEGEGWRRGGEREGEEEGSASFSFRWGSDVSFWESAVLERKPTSRS